MHNTILISLLLMLLPVSVSAQFYTITRDSELMPTERQKEAYKSAGKDVTEEKKNKIMVKDTLIIGPDNQKKLEDNSRNSDRKTSLKTELQKKTDDITKSENNLPELTIPNLYKEIIITGKYYEFNHWTESVRAYYTKVQYKYKGGNYLLWLDEIGYAEDSSYIITIIRLIKNVNNLLVL